MKIWILTALFLIGCTTSPKFNDSLVRPWRTELDRESPSEKPYVAYHKKGQYELLYLAAHHDNNPKSDTLTLVDQLFRDFNFNFLVIEPIPNSEGESPRWFVDEAKKGIKDSIVIGGESSLAVVRADAKKIPFAGGEIDHRELYRQLKLQGYQDEDVIGFYLVRQIPQWVREKENFNELIEKKGPLYIAHYCKSFGIEQTKCPTLDKIKVWYESNAGKKLSIKVDTEEVAPIHGSPLFTHKISSAIGAIRDRFTLNLIGTYLLKYKRVAVVYGGSHYLTLRKSIEQSLGVPIRVVMPETRKIASVCEYGKSNGCAKDEFCINVDMGKTECRANPTVDLFSLRFPFEAMKQVTCDQGPLSPPGNSHTWLNTAFALDLQSDRSLSDVPVFAGARGRVIAFDECKTENDQCGLGFGNSVKVLTEGGHLLFYAHLKRTLVKTGDVVEPGQKIGIEGTTGWTGKDNRHLHLSVHYDWRPAGFEYWTQTGYLPASVPFKMVMCANGCAANCKMTEVDVRTVACRRSSNVTSVLCAK